MAVLFCLHLPWAPGPLEILEAQDRVPFLLGIPEVILVSGLTSLMRSHTFSLSPPNETMETNETDETNFLCAYK